MTQQLVALTLQEFERLRAHENTSAPASRENTHVNRYPSMRMQPVRIHRRGQFSRLAPLAIGGGSTHAHTVLRAGLRGTVVAVSAKPGQHVRQGTVLVIVESMKMENTMTAPIDGTVVSISLKVGQTVARNEVLVEIEADR